MPICSLSNRSLSPSLTVSSKIKSKVSTYLGSEFRLYLTSSTIILYQYLYHKLDRSMRMKLRIKLINSCLIKIDIFEEIKVSKEKFCWHQLNHYVSYQLRIRNNLSSFCFFSSNWNCHLKFVQLRLFRKLIGFLGFGSFDF